MELKDKLTLDELIKKAKDVENLPEKLYELGKKVETYCPNLIKLKKQGLKSYKYLTWVAYEYFLQSIDENHFWWVSHADDYRVEITMTWMDKEYKGSYAVKTVANAKETGKPIHSISNQTINDGMRCYAKLASRVTKFMLHFWLEGSNE